MVTTVKIEKGIASYLDAEIMPKLPANGLERVLTGTALSLMIRRSGKMLDDLKSNKTFQMLGILDDAGDIDVELLAEELKKNIPSEGVKIDVPMVGCMTFHKNDVDKLVNHITKQ